MLIRAEKISRKPDEYLDELKKMLRSELLYCGTGIKVYEKMFRNIKNYFANYPDRLPNNKKLHFYKQSTIANSGWRPNKIESSNKENRILIFTFKKEIVEKLHLVRNARFNFNFITENDIETTYKFLTNEKFFKLREIIKSDLDTESIFRRISRLYMKRHMLRDGFMLLLLAGKKEFSKLRNRLHCENLLESYLSGVENWHNRENLTRKTDTTDYSRRSPEYLRSNIATPLVNLFEAGAVTNWLPVFTIRPPKANATLYQAYLKHKMSNGWCWYADIAKNSSGQGDGMRFGARLCMAIYSKHVLTKRTKDQGGRVKRLIKFVNVTR